MFKYNQNKYVLSTMGVSKESIRKGLIGNRFHEKLRILSPGLIHVNARKSYITTISW